MLLSQRGAKGEAYNQVSGQRYRQNDTVDSDNLKKCKPGIGLLGSMDEGELYDSSDNRQAKVNPIASASMEVPPVGTEAKADLDGQDYRYDRFGIVCRD